MQQVNRDSKPGCGPKNITDDRIGAKRWMEQPDQINQGRSVVVINMAQLEPGVYRAILDDLFAA